MGTEGEISLFRSAFVCQIGDCAFPVSSPRCTTANEDGLETKTRKKRRSQVDGRAVVSTGPQATAEIRNSLAIVLNWARNALQHLRF